MVSIQDSHSQYSTPNRFPLTSASPSPIKIHRHVGRSMRTIRSTFFQTSSSSFASLPNNSAASTPFDSENLTESVIDMRLGELAKTLNQNSNGNHGSFKKKLLSTSSSSEEEFLDIAEAFSDFSACSSDISGELQRLACLPSAPMHDGEVEGCEEKNPSMEIVAEPCHGFLQRESFSTEIIESISPEDLQPTVNICVDGLQSPSITVKRSAAEKLRFLAKNRADNRALIGESGAISALIPLLKQTDPWAQEHAVTALLNLSLYEENKKRITNSGAIKSFVYVLKTGTENAKQNAACALLSLALIEENKNSIGACGAIPPLVSLLINGSNRGKKDALTTLYKICSIKQNKERAVAAGAVKPLVGMVVEAGAGMMAEKAMVVLSSLAAIEEGRETIVEEGGIAALVEAIEDGSVQRKEFAVVTLLQLCNDSVRNRGLLVREGAIPPLVALSQNGSIPAKNKAERLLGYLREPGQESAAASSSSPQRGGGF
ncbi:PREDICTED: U-box domain-containing protein 4-like [Populus euphratica]|uniref:U-box domain-containing protein 4-like n=1 Tax=Populus euphratica TaxID=75702 RepID=A0AAJ6X3Y2_POPEU|nr:PREDICTED: U-box domain-containing protein 4-like [Populus euphratica]XP_011004490.1 PREDICTED: U-box domain-containing protein 4-like [Populus euphratica]XP_011004491.1 PREDICTED: U-box domain-containing protein 4-like [Populus euphratica]